MSTLQSNVVTLQKSYADAAKQTPGSAADISLNVIVRNLPESPNENVASKVNALIRDGLKIKDTLRLGLWNCRGWSTKQNDKSNFQQEVLIHKDLDILALCGDIPKKRGSVSDTRL